MPLPPAAVFHTRGKPGGANVPNQRTRGDRASPSTRSPTLTSLLSPLTSTMSSPSQTPVSSSQFIPIIVAALLEFKEKTGNNLLDNWLSKELQSCDTVEAVLDIIQDQAKAFDKFRGGDKKLMKWINSSVHVLYAISVTLGESISVVRVRKTNRDDLRCIVTSVCRRFLLRKQSLPELVSSSLFVHLCSFYRPF